MANVGDLTLITNPWQMLAYVGSALIGVGVPLIVSRIRRDAEKRDAAEVAARDEAKAIAAKVEQVPELLGTVKYLTLQLEIQGGVVADVQARLAEFEAAFEEDAIYHAWLDETMPRPPYLTKEEFWVKRAAGEL